jgi:hypothetical protein
MNFYLKDGLCHSAPLISCHHVNFLYSAFVNGTSLLAAYTKQYMYYSSKSSEEIVEIEGFYYNLI